MCHHGGQVIGLLCQEDQDLFHTSSISFRVILSQLCLALEGLIVSHQPCSEFPAECPHLLAVRCDILHIHLIFLQLLNEDLDVCQVGTNGIQRQLLSQAIVDVFKSFQQLLSCGLFLLRCFQAFLDRQHTVLQAAGLLRGCLLMPQQRTSGALQLRLLRLQILREVLELTVRVVPLHEVPPGPQSRRDVRLCVDLLHALQRLA
mmetsp:Transcript_132062/g.312996  ORF Transcript_132062/g.312996 Transcript_132062/m.312996 type:complete len:203 (+) Transcript_132062:643-1251(+)